MNPSALCGDAEFLRRALCRSGGPACRRRTRRENSSPIRVPTSGPGSSMRCWTGPEFADTWTIKWADLFKVEEKLLDKTGVKVFHAWIRQSVMDNRPFNEFARDLIASRGSSYKEPAANYYRALRDPHTRSEAMAQVFLGIRMMCAKCHNHPYNQLTQNDYHQLAAFFPPRAIQDHGQQAQGQARQARVHRRADRLHGQRGRGQASGQRRRARRRNISAGQRSRSAPRTIG